MKGLKFHSLFCVVLLTGSFPAALFAGHGRDGREARAPVFVEVRLNPPVVFSHLKPGDLLQGRIIGNVFSGYRLVIPTGSRVSLRVSGTERRRKESSVQWPWPVRYFRSKYRNFPTFDRLTVALHGGGNAKFPVAIVTAYNQVHVLAQSAGAEGSKVGPESSGAGTHNKGTPARGPTIELVVKTSPPKAGTITQTVDAPSRSGGGSLPEIEPLASGTETRLALLGNLSASKSRDGDIFKAMLVDPLLLSSGEILPQGSLFEGHVRKSIAPRWLSRPGSLYLTFNRLVLPTGNTLPIAASVVGIETNRQSRMKVDSEGNLSGERPGKKQLLADLGVSFATSKVADDSFQLIAEALVSTATDASTAGTARLVGMAVGGLLFIKHRGRDVVLPPYTMINIRFDRSPSLLQLNSQTQGMQ